MNPHLQNAREIYEKQGADFERLVTWHLCHGLVTCDNRAFAMAFHADSDKPFEAVEFHHADTLFCTFCAGDMRHALQRYADAYRFLAFQRDFHGSPRVRLLEMTKFFNKTPR